MRGRSTSHTVRAGALGPASWCSRRCPPACS